VNKVFRSRPMTQADAEEIASWRYPDPYSFYDAAADAGDLAELLDTALRGDEYVSVDDGSGELVGFFQFKGRPPDAIEIGLGLRPDLTGRGLGSRFVEAGLQEVRARFGQVRITLAVATFNRRAISVYEQVGFAPVRTYMHSTNGGEWEFLEMDLGGR
jgi:[ribosomal protein S18]-alanine N-acetyltransferase